MGKRFAIVIGVAAAGVMALGAQTAAAATYNTKVTITQDQTTPPYMFLHGEVISGVRKCELGRRVTVFRQQPGTDRKLGEVRSGLDHGRVVWGIQVPQARHGWHVYARARGAVRRHGLVCRSDRSPIYTMTVTVR
jgi:hypothetical protein